MSFKSRISRQKGLTLVEVMIAMVIGLMLLGGVIQIFVTNKVVARTQSAAARVQENGRMALDILTEEIRMAG